MKNEGMTVDEAYKELKGDIEGMAAKHDDLAMIFYQGRHKAWRPSKDSFVDEQ